MCIVVINNSQISIQFSRKASEAPSVVDGTDTKIYLFGPHAVLRGGEQNGMGGHKKPRQRTDGASVRQ